MRRRRKTRRKIRSKEVRIEGVREGAGGAKEEGVMVSVSIRRIEDEKGEAGRAHLFLISKCSGSMGRLGVTTFTRRPVDETNPLAMLNAMHCW